MSDTPASLATHGSKFVKVNSGATALEFIADPGYLTSETSHADVVVDGDFNSNGILKRTGVGAYGIVTDNSANWDSAFGWGNHASAGYLTSFTETNDLGASVTWANIPDANVPSSAVTQHEGSLSITKSQVSDLATGTLDLSSNKVLYANMYANLVDLPSATTYHGMFAHVHATGKGYFSHASNWVELANNSQLANSANWDSAYGWGNHASGGYQAASSLNTDIDSHLNQSNPTSGYVLSWNGSDYAWVVQSGGGGSYTDSDVDTHLN